MRKRYSSRADQIRALLAEGLTPREVAKKIRCSADRVHNIIYMDGRRERGFHRPSPQDVPGMVADLRDIVRAIKAEIRR
jgi:hypothetical protein